MTKLEKSQHQMTDEEYSSYLEYMTSPDGMAACIYSELGKDCIDKDCYACATQRYACEHDNWEEYQCGNDDYPEWWEEV